MVIFVLIVVSVLLVISLGMQLLGKKDAPHTQSSSSTTSSTTLSASDGSTAKLEGELAKKAKELDEVRAQLADHKEQVKQLKRKAYEQKEAGKENNDLLKARAEVERQASIQLEATRAELAAVTAELAKMKSGGGSKARQERVTEVATKPEPDAPVAAPTPAPAKMIRELDETERERLQRLEVLSSKDRARIAELERDLKTAKGRAETANRQAKGGGRETKLLTDKFRALEKRLNRTLLERDLLQRAIKDIEKKTGVTAERTELTADELELSDRSVDQMHKAEDKAIADAQAKLEAENQVPAAPSAPVVSAPTAESNPTPVPQA